MYSSEVQTSQNVKNGQQDLFMQVSGPPFTRKSLWIIMWLTKKYTLSISIRIFSVLSHLLWSCWVKWAWQRSSPTAAPQHWCTKWCRPSRSSRAKSPPGWRPRASWERDSSRMKGWIRVGNWKEQCRQAEPFGSDRVEIGSVAKKHRENGRTKEPWKWAVKNWQVQIVYSHSMRREEQRKVRIICIIFNLAICICISWLNCWIKAIISVGVAARMPAERLAKISIAAIELLPTEH